jgi:hypothetical protein
LHTKKEQKPNKKKPKKKKKKTHIHIYRGQFLVMFVISKIRNNSGISKMKGGQL